ncbi:MAG: UDP-N-acetylmuramoyl-tripeptide--D-alanyl-D-alanine ligase [Nocardioides sp.]|nr:UDP-N-acetylmuramoyl-tripeptide--D-alanyl-D-alanine ligase [Nocardioides sp.]
MIAMTLTELAEVVGGTVDGDGTLVVDGEAYVDSRQAVPGGLFVAVVGERVDGHAYADGAHAVLGSRPTSAPTVVVDDPVAALGLLARHVVDRLGLPVAAMTGSQGKTGTKDYLAHVLAGAGATVATRANNNNELGVPLTALRADAGTDHLVVEMGARGIGHIGYLCTLVPPRAAAVLNVGTAHLGEFGSREAIAAAKGEIVEALPTADEGGVAVLNADDVLVAAMASRTRARVLTFGAGPDADLTWRGVELDDRGRPRFELGHAGEWAPVVLRQTGEHQVLNAAAAAGLALALGMSLTDVAARLSSAEAASAWRMALEERADGLLVLNDSYNANPESTAAAVRSLAQLGRARTGRTIAVLGEMLELGDGRVAGHREVGEGVADAGIDVLVTVGEVAEDVALGAREAPGEAPGEVILTAGRAEATAWLRNNATADDVVLVKASRGAALDQVAADLLSTHADEPAGTDGPEGGSDSR